MSNGYPFLSRRQILARIESEPAFAAECVAILRERHERRAAAGGGESMGWMASHAAKATKLAAKLAAGEASEKDRADAVQLVSRYAKQLARVFRERDLAARPELGAQAAVFGIAATPGGPAVVPVLRSGAEPTERPPAPKRRGRPKGSKNKPKAEQLRRLSRR